MSYVFHTTNYSHLSECDKIINENNHNSDEHENNHGYDNLDILPPGGILQLLLIFFITIFLFPAKHFFTLFGYSDDVSFYYNIQFTVNYQ